MSDSDSDDVQPAVDVLLLGGSGAGKTLLVRHLACRADGTKLTDLTTSPTTGVELDEIGSGKTALAVWEVGAPMTPMWHTYYGSSYIITYMIDASNPSQLSQAAVELLNVLAHEKTAGTPVLVLLNKCDAGATVSTELLKKLLRFDELVSHCGRPLELLETSAKTGAGVPEAEAWMREAKARAVQARAATSRQAGRK